MPTLKIISWKVQGAGNKQFLHSLKDIIRMNDPTILVLLETRISRSLVEKVCSQIGFDSLIRSEASEFSGGIWVLWHNDRVVVTEVEVQNQMVTLEIRRAGKHVWLFSAIYANPKPAMKEILWKKLLLWRTISHGCSLEILTKPQLLKKGLELRTIFDAGAQIIGLTRTYGRLDRGLCNTSWRELFGEASNRHLPKNQSDNVPLLLNSDGFAPNPIHNKPFRFQAAWGAPYRSFIQLEGASGFVE
ncbi:LOW QUALITY PROTEIN: hypothetical protein V2J09_010489 [Rumex salicifolius]